MRIAFICQYFPPEIGAPAARVSELSVLWTGQGHDVTVVTGFPNHPTGKIPAEYAGAVFRRETYRDVHVWRNWVYATPNEGFVRKTLSHLSFMITSICLSGPRLRGVDVVVVSSPTFFSVISAWMISRLHRVPLVFEVRDLWPGIFVELGVLKNRMAIRLLEAIEMFLYRASARVVVVTESFADILASRGVPRAKLATVTNGVDTVAFAPAEQENAIRQAHGLSGKFVMLYIGAHGISHALTSLLDAAEITAADHIHWVFVGEGAEKARLVQQATARQITNVTFVPGQPKSSMPSWYAACDVALVPLRNIPLFDAFIPSKMFEIMACGRPIIGSVRGEPRRILEASGAALLVEPEDASAIAESARRLQRDAALRATMGAAGRRFVAEHYERADLAARYASLLDTVVREQSA